MVGRGGSPLVPAPTPGPVSPPPCSCIGDQSQCGTCRGGLRGGWESCRVGCKRKLCSDNRETHRPFPRFTVCSTLILLTWFISREGSFYEETVSKLDPDKGPLTKGRLWENKQNSGCALSKHIFSFSVKKPLAASVLENCMAQTFLNPFNPSQRAPLIVALFFFSAALQYGCQCVLLISSELCRCC